MGDRIVMRMNHLEQHDDTIFEIGGSLYSAKTVGTEAWDIERVSKTPARAKPTDDEKERIGAAMVRQLEADALRAMGG